MTIIEAKIGICLNKKLLCLWNTLVKNSKIYKGTEYEINEFLYYLITC